MARRQYDKIFLGIVAALLIFGVLALSSASLGLAMRKGLSFYNSVLRQILLGVGLGIFLLFLTMRIDYHFWKKLAFPIFILGFLLALAVFVPGLGFKYAGASRWIDISFVFFQPSEILKFGFILYLASWLSARKTEIGSFRYGFVPFLIMTGLVGLILIKQPDIGTLGVITITAAFMFFIGGGRLSQIGILMFLGLALLAVLAMTEPYRFSRILVFLNNEIEPQGIGFQLRQAFIAFGSGGLFGRGFGMSLQKFTSLPEPMGDSIFAVIGEEFGFMGAVFILILFIFFLLRGLKIAKNCPDSFGRLLASGLVILIVVQSFINMAAMTGLLPLTGLPLIFVSQGSSALVMALAEAGILLNISKKS